MRLNFQHWKIYRSQIIIHSIKFGRSKTLSEDLLIHITVDKAYNLNNRKLMFIDQYMIQMHSSSEINENYVKYTKFFNIIVFNDDLHINSNT